MKFKFFRLIPFVLLGVIIIFTWVNIFTTDYFATVKHQLALVMVCLNFGIYFVNFRYGVLTTGIILLLAVFNLLAFFPSTVTATSFVKFGNTEVDLPSIQPNSLLLLLIFLIIDLKFLILSFKEKNSPNK